MASQIKDFETFFKNNHERLFYFALHIVDDEEVSRDIVMDGFEYVLNHQLDMEVKSWEQYISVYVRSRCLDYIRRQKVHEKYVEFCSVSTEPFDTDATQDDERIRILAKLVEELPPRTREVLHHCYLEGKKHKQVAEELGISIYAVHKHIGNALKALRAKVRDSYTFLTILGLLFLTLISYYL